MSIISGIIEKVDIEKVDIERDSVAMILPFPTRSNDIKEIIKLDDYEQYLENMTIVIVIIIPSLIIMTGIIQFIF